MSAAHFWLGRLAWDQLPFWDVLHHPTHAELVNGLIAGMAGALVVVGAVATIALITYYRKWGVLWSKWLTSVDHKRIGIMYIVLAMVMLLRGVIEGVLMRTQQAFGLNGGFLSANHFAQLFTTHGTIMVFFMAMPFIAGIINYVMPLQIGTRDVSFPVMNSISLALTAAGAALVMISLDVGKFSTGGWTGYPPYTEAAFQPGVGPDYWIWALTLSGIGSMLTGVNFVVTILKRRTAGMTLLRMPLFTWAALCTSILLVFAMPPLTVATLLLALDRYLGFHFFTNGAGGNMMNFANLFWLFGHPEVYLLILPAFGVYSELFATFSGKVLYGYLSLVLATMVIAVLSFSVWVHHFFTMGQTPDVNIFFGIATMLIGIPTGVKVYDWLATMYRGRVRLTVPMVYSLAFLVLFVIGGLSGIVLANPTVDFEVHNTLFLVAHFHNMLIPGVLFGMLAAYHYWFPKAFGFRLNERWGMFAAVCWIIGFMLTFFPLYPLGLLGYARRTVAFYNPVYVPYMRVALVGAGLITVALVSLVVQLAVSILNRDKTRVPAGDPWDGRTLEWATPSPPPEYNFAVLPEVTDRDAFACAKEAGVGYQAPKRFADIHLPKNSALGPVLGAAGFLAAFGLVWHMWWLAAAGMLVSVIAIIARGFVRDTEKIIPASEVEREHMEWLRLVASTPAVSRLHEVEPANAGLAAHAT